MKSTIHGYITKLLQLRHKLQLPSYSGTFLISPSPQYISQFIGIYPSSITTKTPLTNGQHIKKFGAKDSKEFTFWAWRDCGIACVKMILETKGKAKHKTIMDLTNEGIKLGGYILYEKRIFVDKGWFHNSLADLLRKYELNTKLKKWQTIESVAKDILDNKMVILSVLVPGRRYIKEDGSFEAKEGAKFGGHLFLATGLKMKNRQIEGLYVHDPRGLKNYQKNTFIPKSVIEKIFTNRTIVVT